MSTPNGTSIKIWLFRQLKNEWLNECLTKTELCKIINEMIEIKIPSMAQSYAVNSIVIK